MPMDKEEDQTKEKDAVILFKRYARQVLLVLPTRFTAVLLFISKSLGGSLFCCFRACCQDKLNGRQLQELLNENFPRGEPVRSFLNLFIYLFFKRC